MTLAECITAGKDVVVAAAAGLAAYFAYLGLSTWKKELKGKSEYQLAKDTLKSVYKVREAFKHVRGSVIYQYEYPEEMTDHHGNLKQGHRHEGTVYVYQERWKKMEEAFGELESNHLEAQVEWGPGFQDVIKDLRSCRTELLVTIQRKLDRMKDSYDREELSADERAKERSVLNYLGEGSKHDEFTPVINAAIGKFEEWLRPYIKKG